MRSAAGSGSARSTACGANAPTGLPGPLGALSALSVDAPVGAPPERERKISHSTPPSRDERRRRVTTVSWRTAACQPPDLPRQLRMPGFARRVRGCTANGRGRPPQPRGSAAAGARRCSARRASSTAHDADHTWKRRRSHMEASQIAHGGVADVAFCARRCGIVRRRCVAFARRCDGFSAHERRFFGARATSSATKSSLTPKSSLTDPSYINGKR